MEMVVVVQGGIGKGRRYRRNRLGRSSRVPHAIVEQLQRIGNFPADTRTAAASSSYSRCER
jgi:hypothetical protein